MPLEEAKTLSTDKQREIVDEAQDRLDLAADAEDEFRIKFTNDLKFVYEDDGQWEQRILNDRVDRPCYTFNRTEGAIDEVVGDQRQSRPQIRVRAAEGGDKELAETFNGLIRNILNVSDAETIQDHAFTFAVAGGFGAWRVVHKFNADDSFEQDILLEEIANPLTAYSDPAATDICKRDARFWVITERISRDDFEEMYPKIDLPTDFHADDDQFVEWYTEDEVRIAGYYRKVSKKRTLLKLSDGRAVFKDKVEKVLDELEAEGVTVVKSREVDATVIEWYKLYGDGVLEGPIEYPWKYIPVVPVYGKRINIEGEYLIKGLTRNAKDPQRSYNYIRSVITEKVLLTPKFQYIMTAKMIKGYEAWWNEAHSSARPYILANVDEKALAAGGSGLPKVAEPNPVPIEMVTIAQMDAEDIKVATGKFDVQLGAPSQERSGVAIREKKLAGDIGSFVYIDNLAKAIKFTGEILVDMIPRIYDTERVIRVLGEDGAEDQVTLNQVIEDEESGEKVIVNDVSVGKYDVVVSVGPSYTSLRQETSDRLNAIGSAFPQLYELAADVIIKNLDIPGSEEIEDRFRRVLIGKGVIKPTDEEKAEAQEDAPQGPSPVEQLALEGMAKRIKKLDAEIDKLKAQTADTKADTQKTVVETTGQAAELVFPRSST
jgi:uncharacterized small protein (DUF1192 family)